LKTKLPRLFAVFTGIMMLISISLSASETPAAVAAAAPARIKPPIALTRGELARAFARVTLLFRKANVKNRAPRIIITMAISHE